MLTIENVTNWMQDLLGDHPVENDDQEMVEVAVATVEPGRVLVVDGTDHLFEVQIKRRPL